LHGIRDDIHESRTGSEDRVGIGGIALFGFNLSLGGVYATRACVVYDVQPLCHARRFLACGNPQPLANRSLIAFTAWSSFAHAAVMGTQALRNMISRGELIGVAVLVIIGAALIALAPDKRGTEAASNRAIYHHSDG
jgi:hypothetical protein